MKLKSYLFALACGLGFANATSAEQYVDYTPQRGAWEVQIIRVDPNHVDDYLVGLRRNLVPVMEIMKSHGIIDQYQVMTKLNAGAGDNVIIIQHYPSLSGLEPEKARDQAIEKEIYAKVPKGQSDKAVAEFEKYRTFVSDEFWTPVDFAK